MDKEYNQPFLKFPAPLDDSLRCQMPKQLAFFSPKLHHDGGSASPFTHHQWSTCSLTAVRHSFLPGWAQNCWCSVTVISVFLQRYSKQCGHYMALRHHVLFCHFLPAILRHQEPRTDSFQSPAMVRSHSFWQSRSLHIQGIPTLLKMEFEGGVVLKFHFKIIPFLQSCFLNDQYSSSFHVIGKQMKIKYLS